MTDLPDLSKYRVNADGETISLSIEQFTKLLDLLGSCATLSINSAALARLAVGPDVSNQVTDLSESIKVTGTHVIEMLSELTGQKIGDDE